VVKLVRPIAVGKNTKAQAKWRRYVTLERDIEQGELVEHLDLDRKKARSRAWKTGVEAQPLRQRSGQDRLCFGCLDALTLIEVVPVSPA